ncbi:hypothetical protein [Planctomycetes bacterium K23_9]|uniref:hypothetical protein n=1 Tax=Stieleria marina TaxID=1930275 RepID=UPI0011A141D7
MPPTRSEYTNRFTSKLISGSQVKANAKQAEPLQLQCQNKKDQIKQLLALGGYTPEVSNNASETQQKQHLPNSAVSPAVTSVLTTSDAEQLAELVRRWPTLSDAVRNAILMFSDAVRNAILMLVRDRD